MKCPKHLCELRQSNQWNSSCDEKGRILILPNLQVEQSKIVLKGANIFMSYEITCEHLDDQDAYAITQKHYQK